MTLIQLFKEKGFSVDSLVIRLNNEGYTVRPRRFYHYNKGITKPPYDLVVKIAEILEVDFQEVVNALERKES